MITDTSILGKGWQRVALLLFAGMASGLVVADALQAVASTVVEIRTSQQPLVHFNMPAGVSVACVLPSNRMNLSKAACSLQIG